MNQWLGRETCWEDIINLHNQPCVCMIGLHWSEQKTLQIRNMNKCIWKANGYCNHFESQSGTGIFIINTCLTIKFPPQSHHPRNLALASVQHAVWSQSLRPSKGWWSTTQRYKNLNSLMSGLGKKHAPAPLYAGWLPITVDFTRSSCLILLCDVVWIKKSIGIKLVTLCSKWNKHIKIWVIYHLQLGDVGDWSKAHIVKPNYV